MPQDDQIARRPQRRQHVAVRGVEGGAILLDMQTEQQYLLNDVGARVWELVDGTRSIADVVEAVVAQYGATPAQVAGDVEVLLEELARVGLVIWRGE